eukprot:8058716-Pyramimonas_sp.AAC.1
MFVLYEEGGRRRIMRRRRRKAAWGGGGGEGGGGGGWEQEEEEEEEEEQEEPPPSWPSSSGCHREGPRAAKRAMRPGALLKQSWGPLGAGCGALFELLGIPTGLQDGSNRLPKSSSHNRATLSPKGSC